MLTPTQRLIFHTLISERVAAGVLANSKGTPGSISLQPNREDPSMLQYPLSEIQQDHASLKVGLTISVPLDHRIQNKTPNPVVFLVH